MLNDEKKEVGKQIIFHGHKITDKGVLPDDRKIEAVLKMTKPEDITGIKRLCGLVEYMGRFMPDLTDTLEPIRRLTRRGVSFD